MKKILLLLLSVIALAGCSSRPVKYVVKEVKVPVVRECPSIEYPKMDELPISMLDRNATISQTGRAYYISVIQLKKHIDVLEQYIDLYNGAR